MGNYTLALFWNGIAGKIYMFIYILKKEKPNAGKIYMFIYFWMLVKYILKKEKTECR